MDTWNTQLCFEDVSEGDEVPSISLPCTAQRLVMVAGANMGFEAVHYDKDVAKKMGAPDAFANYQYVMMQTEKQLREWCGTRGEIRKIGPFRMGHFTCPGETITCGARVTGKREEEGGHYVDLDVWQKDSNGYTMQGTAVVALPTRGETQR